MFAPKKALLSAALCAALTVPTWASALKDENTSTNSNTFNTAPATPAATWTIETSNAAKLANTSHPLMSLNRGTLTELCQILAENGYANAIANLGQTSIHMAGRILRPVGEYPELFQDELTRINNPDMRQAIRVELRKAINARAEALATIQNVSGTQSEDQPREPLLAPWGELLGENASLQHLIRALKMLQPQNIERLGKNGLLQQLAAMPDKAKALCLSAHATEIFHKDLDETTQAYIFSAALKSSLSLHEISTLRSACEEYLFTEDMGGLSQADIIAPALASARPFSEYAAIVSTCRAHLFTDKMDGPCQARVIGTALKAPHPHSKYAALGADCKRLFTEKMDRWDQAWIIEAALPLSDIQLAGLVRECGARPQDESGDSRVNFICERARELLAGQ